MSGALIGLIETVATAETYYTTAKIHQNRAPFSKRRRRGRYGDLWSKLLEEFSSLRSLTL